MTNDRNNSLIELLYHVSREVATALDLRTVLQRVLYAAINNVGGERGSIVVMDDLGKPLTSILVHGKRVQGNTTQQLRLTMERGLAGWVTKNRKPALVPDTSLDKRWLRRPDDALQESGAKSAICVPLMAREEIVGILTLVHSLPSAFDRGHLEIMQAIADQVGVAILNARLYAESQRQARVMTALAESAATINASLKIDDVFQRILNQTMQALRVETVALALKEKSTGEFIFRAAAGNMAENAIGKRVLTDEGVLEKVVKEKRGIVIPALKDDNPLAKRNFFEGIGSNAVAIAPIQAQGKVIGVMEAINPVSGGSFDPEALLVMTGIGNLAGTTIHNAQLFTQVEETQKRYYDLYNDSIDPILITDWDGKIFDGNRKTLSLSKYDANTLRSMNIEETHEINWAKVGKAFKCLSDDQNCEYEATYYVKDGKSIPVEVYVRSIYFGMREAIQWTFRDISERKELDNLRNDMTAMIYHDLRSPLANVVSSLDILDGLLKEKSDPVESVLKIANNSIERMQRLISSLLDINRFESGQEIATQQGVSSRRLIQDALDAVSPAIISRRQKMRTNLEENLPNIWVDDDMIRRVLINLLENASKFTPMDGNIEIGAKVTGEWLQLWVADDGMGISRKDRSSIFEKFTRATGKEATPGLGIGLAFCRLAVNSHGGKIWIDNNRDKGTRFNIKLLIEKIDK